MDDSRLFTNIDKHKKAKFKYFSMLEGKTMTDQVLEWIDRYLAERAKQEKKKRKS